MNDIDPFEGIETVNHLPIEPSSNFRNEIRKRSKKPKINPNINVIRGIKRQSVLDFAQYLKDNCASKFNTDLSVSLEPMLYSDLDRMVERFFDR